jgi:hypothetical protein
MDVGRRASEILYPKYDFLELAQSVDFSDYWYRY